MQQYTTALTIAGSDSSGGAGIQADLKTFSALGCYGMSVITALTAQNTQGVFAIHPVPTDFIAQQLDAIFSDIKVDAIKIGMLHNVAVIDLIAAKLPQNIPIVLDPVMVSQSGHKLLEDNAIESLPKLFPLVTLITPNIPEAELLLKQKIQSENDMEQAAKELGKFTSVLLKGGHSQGDTSADCLYSKNKIHWLNSKRINTKNLHGTGCTLSSAITSFLALGNDLLTAVTKAKKYITAAILSGSKYKLGHGSGPVNHFFLMIDYSTIS